MRSLRATALRPRLAAAATVLSAAGLVLYAAFSLFVPVNRLIERWPQRYAPDDVALAARWDCVAELVERIPDGASVRRDALSTYWLPQFVTAGYPRIDFSGRRPADFAIVVDETSETPFASVVCGEQRFEVRAVAP